MSNSLAQYFSDVIGDVHPLVIVLTIIVIAIFMINMFRTSNEKKNYQEVQGDVLSSFQIILNCARVKYL